MKTMVNEATVVYFHAMLATTTGRLEYWTKLGWVYESMKALRAAYPNAKLVRVVPSRRHRIYG